jgi:hypothetical protein
MYLQDLQLRTYSPKAQEVYVECVALFAAISASCRSCFDRITFAYQVFLAREKKASWSRFNQTVCTLRFL